MKIPSWIRKGWSSPVWSAVIATLITSIIFTCKDVVIDWWNRIYQNQIKLKYDIRDEKGYPAHGVLLTIYDSTYFLTKNNSEILIPDKNDSVISITYSKPGYQTVTINHNLYFSLDISLRKSPSSDE